MLQPVSHKTEPQISLEVSPAVRLLPGLLLVAGLSAAAYLLARVPGFDYAGPLGLALLLGVAWRFSLGAPQAVTPGIRFTGRTLLRLGIVLLGVRLNFTLLYSAGLSVLLLDLLIIVTALFAVIGLGRLFRLPRSLAGLLAVGTAICGASAIVAAAPLFRADEDDVTQAVAVISVLGVLGVIAFTLLNPLLGLSDVHAGMLLGATLQEVGHVMAAAAAGGAEVLDVAAVTKLTRVALLAPVLIILGLLVNGRGNKQGPRVPVLPGFLLGFLALGVINSLGLLPASVVSGLESLSVALLSAAMVAIGLGVSPAALRRTGATAAMTAGAGFVLLVGVALLFLQLPLSPG